MTKLIVAYHDFANAPRTLHDLDMFPFSVKNLGLRTAPSDPIQQPYPHPKPYLTTKTDAAPEELCDLFCIFGTPYIEWRPAAKFSYPYQIKLPLCNNRVT
jgi:hypothetical protein